MLKIDKNGKRFYQINKNIKQYSDCVICTGKQAVLQYLKNFAECKWSIRDDFCDTYTYNLEKTLKLMCENTLNYSKIYYNEIVVQKINKKTYHIFGY